MPLCNLRSLTQQTGLPLLEVRLLAEHVTGITRTQWLTDPQQDISTELLHALEVLLARRSTGEPVAYLLGSAEFYGRPFTVSPDVLIPRPETEELVEAVLAYLSSAHAAETAQVASPATQAAPTAPTAPQITPPPLMHKPLRVLDVGTGSGVIAITLALEYPGLEVHACDISPAALHIAQSNAKSLKAPVSFRHSDWLSAYAPSEPFDLIISNPPYIMAGDRHLEQGDLRFEPATALTDHADGLTAYTELAKASQSLLRPGGSLWVEHGWHQQTDIIRIFEQSGLRNVSGHRDLSGHARMVRAFKPAD